MRAVARVLPRRELGQARHELAVGSVGRCAALDVDGDGAAAPGEAAVACQTAAALGSAEVGPSKRAGGMVSRVRFPP